MTTQNSPTSVLSPTTHHDAILTGIPLLFLTALGLATHLPTSHVLLVAIASLLSSLLILDALLIHPPQTD